jgi:hypothetical protein
MTHNTFVELDLTADRPKLCLVTAKQYDRNSRAIYIMPYNNGNIYFLPDGATARVRMQKPSGAYIYNYCESETDGEIYQYIIVVLTSQCLTEEGTVTCDLEIALDDEIISTVAFTMEVYASPYSDDAVESSNEMNAVDQKFKDIQDSVDSAKEWASVAQAVTGVNVATYELAGIVKPNPESIKVDEYGRISAVGAVADVSTVMLLYGFRSKNTVFNDDGSITETDADGYVKNTVFESDGNITETFLSPQGETLRYKTTIFNSDGSITETSKVMNVT